MTLSFTAETKELARVIAGAANALPAHPSQPVYTRMLLSAGDNVMSLLASDGESRLEIRGACETEAEGSCTVPGRLLNDISRYFAGDQIHVENTGSELVIGSGRSRFSIPAGAGDDYPVWKMPAPLFIRLDGDELALALRQAAPSTGEHPACLTAICLDISDGKLSVVATDRNRMAVTRLPFEVSAEVTSVQALLPARAAERFARNLEGEVSLGWNEGIIFMTCPGGEMMTRLIADPFPKWRKILAKEPPYTGITFGTKEMIRAVRMAQLAAGSDNRISWTFSKDEIAVRAEREGRECAEYTDCTYDGESITFLLGAQYMLDGLQGDVTEITFTDQMAPLFLRSENFTYTVLPRREL